MRTTAISILLALFLAACGGGGGGSTGIAGDDGGGDDGGGDTGGTTLLTSMSAEEEADALRVLELLNVERATAGLPPLEIHVEASEVAYRHGVDMDVRAFFSHTNPDGLEPWDRVAAAGIANWGVGENIAWGYGSPVTVMNAWMDSPGHRANILHDDWTHVGIGVHDGPGGPWWTQVFLRVLP